MMLEPDQQQAPSGLAELLGSLASEGSLNSSGTFTVDLRAALPKLEKFQLPRPYFGLLKVVQSGVASGASFVDCSFTPTGIIIEHDGQAPEPAQLRELFNYLLSSQRGPAERALRDLAVGVNTSLARGASWVEVSARGSEGWINQRWTSRSETSQSERMGDTRANLRFELRRTGRQTAGELYQRANKDIFQLLKGSRDVLDEDARAVFDRCRHSPVPVRINGRPTLAPSMGRSVMRRWSPWKLVQHRKASVAEVYLMTDRPSPHLLSPPPLSEAPLRFVMEGAYERGEFHGSGALLPATQQRLRERCCFAVLCFRGVSTIPGEMIVVKDGVDLARLTPPSLPRGVSVLLTAEGMRLDLSQFRIVDTEETRERLDWISHRAAECARGLLEAGGVEWTAQQQSYLKGLFA